MSEDPPVCDGCGEPKAYVEPYPLAGEPGGYFCTNEACGHD